MERFLTILFLFIKKNATFLVVLPLAGFIWFFLSQSFSIPFHDDWQVLYIFLKWHGSDWIEKINLLFAQHNEHRIVITRLFALCQYYFSNQIDMQSWIFFGNAGYVLLIGVIYFYLKNQNFKELILPVSFLVLSPFAHSNILNGMQNSNTLFISFSLTILYLACYNKNIWIIVFFGLVVMFTNGGGIIILFLTFCILLFHKEIQKTLLFALISFFLCLIYYWDYAKPLYHPDGLSVIFSDIPQAISFFFVFLGSIGKTKNISLVLGVVFVIISILFFKRHLNSKNLFPFAVLVFIGMIALATTYSRVGFGIEMALGNRYRIYSQLFAVLLIVIFYQSRAQKSEIKYVYLGLLLFSIAIYSMQMKAGFGSAKELKNKIFERYKGWCCEGKWIEDKNATLIFEQLIQNKQIFPPQCPANCPKYKTNPLLIAEDSILIKDLNLSNQTIFLTIEFLGKSSIPKGNIMALLIHKGNPIPVYGDGSKGLYIFDLTLPQNILLKRVNILKSKASVHTLPNGDYDIYIKALDPAWTELDWVKTSEIIIY